MAVAGLSRHGPDPPTFEILPAKVRLATETFARAGVADVVILVEAGFLVGIDDVKDIAFCFLDGERDVVEACFDAVVPKMVSGGIVIVDNTTNHRDELQTMVDRALADMRVDAMVATVARGELICRKR